MATVPLVDRPREKLARAGVDALGDNELIALVLGSGTRSRGALVVAHDVIDAAGGVQGLFRIGLDELRRIPGVGQTRAASVFNGLLAVRDAVASSDWVLVHDAARPCLGTSELERLLGEVGEDDTGGLLAVPVADTLKRGNREGRVVQTQPRDHLWCAQTPQMFRYRLLLEALRATDHALVTDEAGAIEGLGLKPRLVMGDARNIKVTQPADLALAELILKDR